MLIFGKETFFKEIYEMNWQQKKLWNNLTWNHVYYFSILDEKFLYLSKQNMRHTVN